MTNYYTADLHLNHERLIQNSFRSSFDSIEQLNDTILSNINDTVRTSDSLYILGDLTLSSKRNDAFLIEWLSKINCFNIFVVQGNHDNQSLLQYLKDNKIISNYYPWKVVHDRAFNIDINVMCHHYPVLDYHCPASASICLHGHSHGQCAGAHPPDLFDVGVDSNNFKPVTIEQLLSNYYGHYSNPYLGYLDYRNTWKQNFESFCKELDKER